MNTLGRYPGKRMTAKKIAKVIDKIPHETYVEPMVGMGTVFFAKGELKCPGFYQNLYFAKTSVLVIE